MLGSNRTASYLRAISARDSNGRFFYLLTETFVNLNFQSQKKPPSMKKAVLLQKCTWYNKIRGILQVFIQTFKPDIQPKKNLLHNLIFLLPIFIVIQRKQINFVFYAAGRKWRLRKEKWLFVFWNTSVIVHCHSFQGCFVNRRQKLIDIHQNRLN